MLQLLYMVIFGEMALILLLLFKTPLRKLVIMGLDRMKRGRGPLVVKSVGSTVLVIMVYTVYSVMELQSRPIDSLNPTDHVLLSSQILQASLMGFSLFLAFIVDRLHHYIRELRMLRKTMEAARKQNRGFEDGKNQELVNLRGEISTLKTKIKQLESQCEAKDKEVKAAKANSGAFKNQSDDLLLEYDRLLEDNKNLRDQLREIESHS